jgi:hypothetical protein
MSRAFQFVDHRDGIILNRNLALAAGVYQKLIASQAKLSRTLPWLRSAEGTAQRMQQVIADFDAGPKSG